MQNMSTILQHYRLSRDFNSVVPLLLVARKLVHFLPDTTRTITSKTKYVKKRYKYSGINQSDIINPGIYGIQYVTCIVFLLLKPPVLIITINHINVNR